MRNLYVILSLASIGAWWCQHAFALGSSPLPPEGSVAANIQTLSAQHQEHCSTGEVYSAPELVVTSEGRLTASLRQAAQNPDTLALLTQAAKSLLTSDAVHGRAYSDLAVTGRAAYGRFRALHEQGRLTHEAIVDRLRADESLSGESDIRLELGANSALNRAYRVANALPYGNSGFRRALGWIALSGEDDPPYRPVNVPSAAYTQHDLTVNVNGIPVRTRYIIAESLRPIPTAPEYPGLELPAPPRPRISPNAKVLLYVHGMDSRLEESLDLMAALRVIARDSGENWTIISMDLPSSGYADKIDHTRVSALSELGEARSFPPGFNAHGRQRVPVLDFIENFVVKFVDTLDAELPVKSKIQAVIGGSLGGNITFRLGRRHDIPWLKKIVTWSPASIWSGLADGADIFKQLGVATAWKRAGGDASQIAETPSKREEFFSQAFGGAIKIGAHEIVPAQPDHWWSRDWMCFDESREASRVERFEIYHPLFRLWHWRLAAEQLIYSHQTPPGGSAPRYMNNHIPMLLAAGEVDDFNFTNIFRSTKETAARMTHTPGKALFFENTGHSIHNERPRALARAIVTFLKGL